MFLGVGPHLVFIVSMHEHSHNVIQSTTKYKNTWTDSASHLLFSVNHSPPLSSLLAAGLNQTPISTFSQQCSNYKDHIVSRGTLAEAPGWQ